MGPSLEFLIESTAKHLDGRETDNLDKTTIYNATSVQISVDIKNAEKLLLVGDAIFDAFDDKIKDYKIIQLPHHGNYDQAIKIFNKVDELENEVKYIISDNTGSSNGGSDNIYEQGKNRGKEIKNTNKESEDILIDANILERKVVGTLGK